MGEKGSCDTGQVSRYIGKKVYGKEFAIILINCGNDLLMGPMIPFCGGQLPRRLRRRGAEHWNVS